MSVQKEFYRLQKDKVISQLNTSPEKGLSSRQVKRRLSRYGFNELPDKKARGALTIFRNQFKDFMILVLIVATIISFIMGETSDALTIFAIVILNAIMGFVQEYRAEKSLESLNELTSPAARVVRNKQLETVASRKLVPGDIVSVAAGDIIPSDLRLINSSNLQVNESHLTGESVPVNKTAKNLYAPNLSLQKQKNMVFMGSKVNRGSGKGIVVKTGSETEMGKIAGLLAKGKKTLTPLQKRLQHLGKWLVAFSILLTVLIVITGISQGQSAYQMFMAGVSLAVAAIPEGLPAIVTLALAIGVQKMIKKKAIVRQLPAVETLGCATVICSDKTGTLTGNQMKVAKIFVNNQLKTRLTDNISAEAKKILAVGVGCNQAQKKHSRPAQNEFFFSQIKEIDSEKAQAETENVIGDPTDIALIKKAASRITEVAPCLQNYQKIKHFDFDSRKKRMSTVVKKRGSEVTFELWTKGAPEVILEKCSHILVSGKKQKLTSNKIREIKKANKKMSTGALRVLALGYRKLTEKKAGGSQQEMERNLILLGLVGLIDPPRPEVKKAVASCQRAGIRPIMITGDQKLTARVIAKKIGIPASTDRVITGRELKKLNSNRLAKLVKQKNVFARIEPEDKLKIVRAFKKNGQVVAMTGDGVNDAPAVKEADIGIAMGKNGTQVTREVSSLILADDNFATIIAAVKQGRQIYNNIRKFIRYLLSCNIGELLAIFLGITMGLPLPLIPIQILWVNLVTDGLPALALGLDPDSEDVMKLPPRDPGESIFAGGLIGKIASQGLLIGFNTLLVFLIGLFRLETGLSAARTMAFCTLVFSQLFFVFSCRSEKKSIWQTPFFKNKFLVGAVIISSIMQLLVIYHPFLNGIFQTQILNGLQWVFVLLFSAGSTVMLEIINKYIRKAEQRKTESSSKKRQISSAI